MEKLTESVHRDDNKNDPDPLQAVPGSFNGRDKRQIHEFRREASKHGGLDIFIANLEKVNFAQAIAQ